ncbi:MAG: S41 family peptidase [Bacteroidota bacterium]
MKIYPLLIIAVLLSNNDVFAQQKFNSDELQKDLTILGDITIGVSPKLTEEERQRIDQLVQKKKASLEGKMLTTMSFFNFLSEVDFQTKFDEHASLGLTEEVLIPLLTKSKLFPLPIKIIGNKVVVNSSDAEVPFGSIIRAINGTSINDILEPFIKHDDDTFAKRRLESQFSLAHLIKQGSFETFQIDYTAPSNPDENLQKTVAGIDFGTYRNVFSETVFPLHRDKLQNLINTHLYEKDRTYYLQLNSFNWDSEIKQGLFNFLSTGHKSFDKKFNDIFKEISDSKAENLIIDLRFNMGGNVKVPGVLYSYIAQNTFTEDISVAIQDFEIPNKEYVTKISGDKVGNAKEVGKFIKRYQKYFTPEGDSRYVWAIVDNETRQPSKNAFKGKVYLLVGGNSVSASAYFAALFKSQKRGVIIGEQMGGSYLSLSAGQILTYQLPTTKIELETPIMEVNFSDQLYQNIKTDRVAPDVKFEEDEHYQYFVLKKDIAVEKVMEQIRLGSQ